jgi:hypothetical protein
MKQVDEKASGAADADQQRVQKLEAIRNERGYKPGWLYFKCKEAGLLDAFKQLEREGLVGNQPNGLSQVQETGKRRKQLSIEMVPEPCWFINLRSELDPNDWKRLKQRTYRKANYRCEVCGGRGPEWPVECHEIWHYNDEEHIQELVGLIALCPACHEVKHMGFATMSGRGDIAAQHLAEVNEWTTGEADRYIKEQFAVWEERNKYTWRLDLTWLNRFGIKVTLFQEAGPEKL